MGSNVFSRLHDLPDAILTVSGMRTTKELNVRLKEASCIYLEHHQFSNGFDFLDKLITNGTSNGEGQPGTNDAILPLRVQIALAATLVVHPDYTSRGSLEEQAMSLKALAFLRHCLETAGPDQCQFAGAFQFLTRKADRRRGRRASQSNSDEEETVPDLTTHFVGKKSLFAQTESFWNVVGWAFNCAHHYPLRWTQWRLLLDFWLDIVHAELSSVKRFVPGSLLASIFEHSSERHALRKIMRAIFADGGQVSQNEFGEIYEKEIRLRRKQDIQMALRKRVNIEEDHWADYDLNKDDDDDVEMEDVALSAIETAASAFPSSKMDVVHLQARFSSLLLIVATLQDTPLNSAPALLDYLTEFIRPLPLSHFMDLLNVIDAPFHLHLAMLLNTIEVYLPGGLPKTNLLHVDTDYVCKYFLHEEARTTSAIDNAKLSILVEYVIGLLIDNDSLSFVDLPSKVEQERQQNMQQQIRRGVDARLRKVDLNRKSAKQRNPSEMHAEQQLKYSGDRILGYLALLQQYPAMEDSPSAQLTREASVLSESSVLSSPGDSESMSSVPNMSV